MPQTEPAQLGIITNDLMAEFLATQLTGSDPERGDDGGQRGSLGLSDGHDRPSPRRTG